MNKKVLETLEFNKIKELLFDFINTNQGRNEVANLLPSTNYDLIVKQLNETDEAVKIDQKKGGIPVYKLADIKMHLKRLEIGAILSATELSELSKVLQNSEDLVDFFVKIHEDDADIDVDYLFAWVQQIVVLSEVTKEIKTSIDNTGLILDEASFELNQIRRNIRNLENNIKKQLDNILKSNAAKYLSEAVITIRDNRYVVPVKASYRQKFGGTIHDQSQTGQTLYIEPQVTVELNNKISELKIKESYEEQRILMALSDKLRPFVNEIKNNSDIIGHLDFTNAKARLALQLNAVMPKVNNKKQVSLKDAWHPMIAEEKAVKNTIDLGFDYKTIIITGPNTGGKTITIKTLGLLQLMGQSGLFITSRDESEIGIFDEIFADIGDEQSIEQSLSTFSSHMSNIVDILNHIDENSLVILDEIGSGTDPKEGAALAMAILDKMAALGSYAIVTTHYPELKLYGFDRPETINASMVFDINTLKPTYKFLLGVPGQSNAITISKRLGLSEDIIYAAEGLLQDDEKSLNKMIADLVAQKEELKKQNEALALERETLLAEKTDYENKKINLEKQEAKIILEAKEKSNSIVSKTIKESEKIISELRNARLRGQNLNEQELQKKSKDLKSLKVDNSLEKNKVLQKAKKIKELKAGDEIVVQSYNQQGTLLKKHKNGQWEVQLGILKMLVDEDDLVKTERTQAAQEKKKKIQKTKAVGASKANVKSKLDLRGERYEIALARLDKYLDEAVLANFSPVEIIHGKGTGALRKGVTEFLRSDRRVKSYRFANANAGGDGATIVELK